MLRCCSRGIYGEVATVFLRQDVLYDADVGCHFVLAGK
jgi:hypothetical protein